MKCLANLFAKFSPCENNHVYSTRGGGIKIFQLQILSNYKSTRDRTSNTNCGIRVLFPLPVSPAITTTLQNIHMIVPLIQTVVSAYFSHCPSLQLSPQHYSSLSASVCPPGVGRPVAPAVPLAVSDGLRTLYAGHRGPIKLLHLGCS